MHSLQKLMDLVADGHCLEAQVEPISCFQRQEVIVDDDEQKEKDHNGMAKQMIEMNKHGY